MASTSSPDVVRSAATLAASPSSTQSRSQSRFTRMVRTSSELLEEAQVVLEERPQVVDAVAKHREPLDAHAERVAAPGRRVDAGVAQHVRMDHAAAQDLEPASRLRAHVD